MLKILTKKEIIDDKDIKNLFLSASFRGIHGNFNILKSNFYLDSFYYFPIIENNGTFPDLFKRQNDSIKHFYTEKFFLNLKERKNSFKIFEKKFVLGSSPADNYYSNLFYFLPRIFLTKEKKVNLIVHRNLSNKFRNFIRAICSFRKIDINFTYLDDGFYKFNNSFIPQFLDLDNSTKILKLFLNEIINKVKLKSYGTKIYVRRENVNYRKILNEADLIEKLKKNGFQIINPNHFEIFEQIKIFSEAELIISPHGSNLSNLVFCKKNTRVYEIAPNANKPYEIALSNRYKQLAYISGLKYYKIKADSVDTDKHSDLINRYISRKILNESNFYKNLIIKISEIDDFINNI